MTEYFMNIGFFERENVGKAISLSSSLRVGESIDLVCNNEMMRRVIHSTHIEFDRKSNSLRLTVLSSGAQFYITKEKDGVYSAEKII